ncbi:MAG: hypothetical protein AAF628_01170 [Planctomycetota bacterium]
MASSTSSSDHAAARRPDGPWLTVVGAGALVASLALGAWELCFRAAGFVPHAIDSNERWAAALQHGLEADRAVLWLGSSRIQQAIHMPTVQQRLDDRVTVQLGLTMGSPLPLLEFLADRTTFAGTAVAEVTPSFLFARPPRNAALLRDAGSVAWFAQQQREQRRLTAPAYAPLEDKLSLTLQERLVTCSGDATLAGLTQSLLAGDDLTPPFWWITRDRMQILDYGGIDVPRFAARRAALHAAGTPRDAGELVGLVANLRRWAAAIEERGGRVVLLRLPTQGGVRDVEAQRYPDDRYWDRLVQMFGGAALDGRAHAPLTSVRMTDGDHVDAEDAPAFTTALLDLLEL